jgi:acyl CoA:acetate/3-ketoacid CoA transferase alpha subunit
MKLSPQAKSALDTLQEKQLAYTIAKATIEAELKQELIDRLSSFKYERDLALYLAGEAGVPRTKLGKTIGTTNYRTVQDILADANRAMPQTVQDNTKYSITQNPDGTLILRLFDVGPGSISGIATITIADGELVHQDGDAFVIPQAYRNGLAEEIVAKYGE